MRPLATERLRLEPQVAAHAAEMFAVLSDPAIYQYENAPPRSRAWLRERYVRLESRRSADGVQAWLNWVMRLRTGEAIGYVQATVFPDGRAAIAYEMASRFWGRGFATEACAAMLAELATQYRVHSAHAIFKRRNQRSLRLVQRLGFVPGTGVEIEPDELLMTRRLAPIRDARAADFAAIAALNKESEHFVSPMSEARLAQLDDWAAYHRVIEAAGAVAAFLIAFREGARYDSPNYRWFSERYTAFVYIDRLIVAPAQRRRGFGAALYADVFDFARRQGVSTVLCEFDVEPPNEVSRRFHLNFGFHEVGAHSYNGKRVSMQASMSAIAGERSEK